MNTCTQLPEEFIEKLKVIVPADNLEDILSSFDRPDPYSFRVNTLRISIENAHQYLIDKGIEYENIPFIPGAFFVSEKDASILAELSFKDGLFYKQSVSSMLPVLMMDLERGMNVLDLCAAPGSKTTQIAMQVGEEGRVTAVEKVRKRFFKLRSVCDSAGADNVKTICADGRGFRSAELFDRILVDAPCSSEGRFKSYLPKSYSYWSHRKVKEMSKKQKGLLLSASRLLKKGGLLIYSTCTFSPEENEFVVDWFMKKTQNEFSIKDVHCTEVPEYPCLSKWKKRIFHDDISKCLRVLPTNTTQGFFIAAFRKN